MPIYEYQCDGCSEVFEVFQKVSDPAPSQHSCGSTQLHRVLSNTSFVLKGTGWYITDYARKDQGDGKGGSKNKKDGDSKEAKEGKDSKETSSSDSPKKDSSAASDTPKSPGGGGGGGGGAAAV